MRDPVLGVPAGERSENISQRPAATLSDTHILQPELMKAIAISLVVLRHSFAPFTHIWSVSRFYEYSLVTDVIGHYVSSFSMPLFVSISGFTYSYLRNHLGKYGSYSTLVKKKTKRLMVPYLFFAPLYIFFYMEYDSVSSFMAPMWTGSGHLWFILMLFLTFVMFYPVERYFKRSLWLGLGAALVLTPFSLLLPAPELNPLSLVLKYFPFFFLGYVLFCKAERASTFLMRHLKAIFITHLVLFGVVCPLHLHFDQGRMFYAIDFLMTLSLGVVSILFVFGLTSSIAQRWTAKPRQSMPSFNWPSYYIYLLHQPILMSLFTWQFLQGLPPIVVIPSAFVTAFGLSFVVGRLLLRTRLGKSLVGA